VVGAFPSHRISPGENGGCSEMLYYTVYKGKSQTSAALSRANFYQVENVHVNPPPPHASSEINQFTFVLGTNALCL